MKPTLSIVFSVSVATVCVFFSGYARAESQTCELVAADVVAVDGLLDDWRGIRKRDIGGKDKDASFTLYCAYDDKHLYLAVNVRDDHLSRRARPKAGQDDNLIIQLTAAATATLTVYPGTDRVAPVRTWNQKPVPVWLQVEDTQQQRGWSVELAVPLARIRGLGKGSPGVKARVEYRDSDRAGKAKPAFSGLLEFAAAASLYRSFLQTTGLKPGDIRLDEVANVDDTPGPERVVVGGKLIGILSDQFAYMELPVAGPRDILKVELADLRGDGTRSIITEFRQHGNGGSRDVVVVWQVSGNGRFERLLAFETRKALGDRVLVNRWSLVPAGTARKVRGEKKGRDLVIEVSDGDVTGWDEDTYNEAPAQDMRPILTPWSDQTSAVYYFAGNAVLGGDPKVAPKGRKPRK